MEYAQKYLRRNIKTRLFWPRVFKFIKQLGIYFGILIAFGILFYNPISLSIICGTLILVVLILKLTEKK